MSDPYTEDPDAVEEPDYPEEPEMPGFPDSMVDPDVQNPTGEGDGEVEADTASGGAPER